MSTSEIIDIAQPYGHDYTIANDNAGPGNVSTVWNMPRDMETDVALVLRAAFDTYGLDATKITITTAGSYQSSRLRLGNKIAPVIVVSLSNDSSSRIALNDDVYVGQAGDSTIVDGRAPSPNSMPPDPGIAPVLTSGQGVSLKSEMSTVTVDIDVDCLDKTLCVQTHLFVKTAMFAAKQTFIALGYINPPLRISTSQSEAAIDIDGGPKVLFTRTVSYTATHLDFIAGIDALASLIAIKSQVDQSVDPDGFATQTVSLEPPPA